MIEDALSSQDDIRLDSNNASYIKSGQGQQRFGDAGPFGLSAFAFTTFLMALINLSVGGVEIPNIVIGPALIYGGLGQLLAGMWYVFLYFLRVLVSHHQSDEASKRQHGS